MNGPDSNYFRDYDPVTGRYVESDPLGLAAGINPYAYTEGDPVGRSDPQGLLDDPNGLFTQPAVQVLKRCLIPAGTGTAATVVAIVGGAVALAAPLPRVVVTRYTSHPHAAQIARKLPRKFTM